MSLQKHLTYATCGLELSCRNIPLLPIMCRMKRCCRISFRYLMPIRAPATCTTVDLRPCWIPAHTMTLPQPTLKYNVPLDVCRHMCVHQHMTRDNKNDMSKKTQPSTWHRSISPFAGTNADTKLWVKMLHRTGLLKKIPASLS